LQRAVGERPVGMWMIEGVRNWSYVPQRADERGSACPAASLRGTSWSLRRRPRTRSGPRSARCTPGRTTKVEVRLPRRWSATDPGLPVDTHPCTPGVSGPRVRAALVADYRAPAMGDGPQPENTVEVVGSAAGGTRPQHDAGAGGGALRACRRLLLPGLLGLPALALLLLNPGYFSSDEL